MHAIQHIVDSHVSITFTSVIQLQALVARLVRGFQFSEVEDKPITLWRPGLVVPIVAGDEDRGPQPPLKVLLVLRN